MKLLKGRLSINRLDGGSTRFVRVEVIDAMSGTRVCEVDVDMTEFANIITGMSQRPCEIRYYPQDAVGKKAESKEELVPIYKGKTPKEVLAPFEVDGWVGREKDLENNHRYVRNEWGEFQRVTFYRHVDVD